MQLTELMVDVALRETDAALQLNGKSLADFPGLRIPPPPPPGSTEVRRGLIEMALDFDRTELQSRLNSCVRNHSKHSIKYRIYVFSFHL